MTGRIRRTLGMLSLVTIASGAAYSYAAPADDPACHARCAEEYQQCQDWGFVEWYCELQYNICTDECRNP